MASPDAETRPAGPTLLVMAAGLGSRFGGDKQVLGVGPRGETLLEYAIYDARRVGFGRIVFVTRRELSEAFDALASRLPGDLTIDQVFQEGDDLPGWYSPPARTRPWGTVHAVLAGRRAIDTTFGVLNADDFYGAGAFDLAAEACRLADRTGDATVIGLPLDVTLSEHGAVVRGICDVDEAGWLRRLEEVRGIVRTEHGIRGRYRGVERLLTARDVASMNFWVFTPEIFGLLGSCFDEFLREHGTSADAELPLPDAVHDLVASGEARVAVREAPGPWFGLTHAADQAHVQAGLRRLVAAGVYPDPLW